MTSWDPARQRTIERSASLSRLVPYVYRVWLFIFGIAVLAVLLPAAPVRHAEAAAAPPPGETELVTARGCGTERWDVKTLTDADAGSVAHTPRTGTVEQLTALAAPSSLSLHTPRSSQERQVYQVTARLLRYKLEKDSDFHIVIAGTSARTMIVEAASPDRTRGASAADLQSIRGALMGFLAILSATTSPCLDQACTG